MFNRRRRRYNALRKQWPDLFINPPDAPYELLFERPEIRAAERAEKRRLASRHLPRSWRRTGVVHEDSYLIVVRDAVRFPADKAGEIPKRGTYIRTMPPNGSAGVAMLPVMRGRILLLRHFRHATRSTHLEIPRGFADPGVRSADQAIKELEEEIEAKTDHLTSLGILHSNTGMAADCVELFLADIREFGQPQAGEGILSIEAYDPLKVAELIHHSKITDAFTIVAFARAWMAGLLPEIAGPLNPEQFHT